MLGVRVLGPMEASIGEERLTLGGPQQRAVLALLMTNRGQVVPVDRLVDTLWPDTPARRAVASLHPCISHLRKVLEPGRPPRSASGLLVSVPPGYAVRLPPEAVDAWRFEAVVHGAREARPEDAHRRLTDALGWWRGPAYQEWADEEWAVTEVARLGALRLTAYESAAAAGLRAGRPALVVPTAEELLRLDPLREEGWRLLALAQWATGRQADALLTLRRARAVVVEELGLEPGPALAELERSILNGRFDVLRRAVPERVTGGGPAAAPGTGRPETRTDAGPGTDAVPGAGAAPGAAAPPTAPPAVPFLGRRDELRGLRAAARVAGRTGGVVLVSGGAGVGKSALLARYAELLRADGWTVVAGRCPDDAATAPVGAWVQVLGALAATVPPPPGGPLGALLAAPDPAAPLPSPPAATAARARLRTDLREWLARAAAGAPLAVLLDDLGRADAQTLALAGEAAALRGAPLLVVAAFRPDEGGERLTPLLTELAAYDPHRLELRGLPAADAAALVRAVAGSPPDADAVAALVERSAGHPGRLVAAARSVAAGGGPGAGGALPGPPSDPRPPADRAPDDRPAPAVHAARPGDPARARQAVDRTLAAADLAERRFAYDVAAELTQRAIDAADTVPGPEGERAERLVGLLGRLLRTQVRAGAADAARRTRDRAASVARLVGRDDLLAAAYAAWTEPTPWLARTHREVDRRAVDDLERLVARTDLTPAVTVRLLQRLAEELAVTDPARALAAAERQLRTARSEGDPQLLAAALATMTALLPHERQGERRGAVIAELRDLTEQHELPAHRWLCEHVDATIAAVCNDAEAVREHAEHGVRIARRYGMPEAEATSTATLAMLAHARGEFDEAERLYERVRERLRGGNAWHGADLYDRGLVAVRIGQGRVAEVEPHARVLYDTWGVLGGEAFAVVLALQGRLDEARAVRFDPVPAADHFHGVRLHARAKLACLLDDKRAAAELVPLLRPVQDQLGSAATAAFCTRPLAHALAEVHVLLGDLPAARAAYARAEEVALLWGADHLAEAARAAARALPDSPSGSVPSAGLPLPAVPAAAVPAAGPPSAPAGAGSDGG